MEFWDQRHRDGKTAEEIPAFGEWKESAGAGCLEVGPGMCQLLQEPREGAGNPGVFQEGWERGALSWLHRGGGI